MDRLLRDLEPILVLDRPRVVSLDLSGLVTVGPAALAVLTGAVKRAQAEGFLAGGSSIIVPRSRAVTNYLLRMDLSESFGAKRS